MNIVLAPDSYKGSLTSIEAADAMKRAIQSLALDDTITSKPIADGGEGQSDEQTLYGKSPGYIANLANANHVPAILISGSLTGDQDKLLRPFHGCFSIITVPMTIQECMERAEELLFKQMKQVVRFILTMRYDR